MTSLTGIIAGVFIAAILVIFLASLVDSGRLDKKLAIIIGVVAFLCIGGGLFFYFNNTASGIREITDMRSELSNGLDREINVYTANGDLIAHYNGKIDLEDNDGGYVIFDYEGKRYTYYNCFIESIANIK